MNDNMIDEFFKFEENKAAKNSNQPIERLHIPLLRHKKDSYVALSLKQRKVLMEYILTAVRITKMTGIQHIVTYKKPKSLGGKIKTYNLRIVQIGE